MTARTAVALAIGVGDYLHADRVPSLRFAARDAKALARTLANPDVGGFLADRVAVLTDRRARRDKIVHRLSHWLPNQARGAELVVIYFAGHGLVQPVGPRTEGFLLPFDADPEDIVTKGVAMSDIARWIDAIDARAVVVCLDCCHAGKVLAQRSSTPTVEFRNMELRPSVLQGMAGKGRYLIASCDEGQKSFESAELKHGLFTYHLLRGIAGAADKDGDGKVGIAELFNYVSAEVTREAREKFGCDQRPWTSATWSGEAYISCPKVPPATLDLTAPPAGEDELRQWLRSLRHRNDPAALPMILPYLAHSAEEVRSQARKAVHALGWDKTVAAVEELARRGEAERVAAALDGLAAFEAHPQVVDLLDRLVVLLKGDLRNRTILLLERKRLGLELDKVADLFRAIQSPYRIQKVLGQGLLTAAYLAQVDGADLEVVVRVLRPKFVEEPHIRGQFLDLSKRSLPFVHQNLALTREVRAFPESKIYYAVRDHIAGVTLQRVLEGGKKFEPVQVVHLLRQVAAALTPFHLQAVCHGGIKPSNIFLCHGERVVLGDPSVLIRDVSLDLDRLSYDYRYAPPELFRGREAPGPQADFYSLGCVAYELACGAPPHVSDNHHELAALHLHKAIDPPSRHGSQLGPVGDKVLLCLLAPKVSDRFCSLDEVLGAFDLLEDTLQSPPADKIDGLLQRTRVDSLEVALKSPPTETPPPATPAPLLHDASLLRYQTVHSMLHFEPSAALSLSPGVEAPRPVSDPTQSPEVPGYEILKRLGSGGMGTVYQARHKELNRTVALKVLPFERTGNLQGRFRTEAMAAARLQHPNIVQIYDIGQTERIIYLALEYVEGGSLAEKLRRQGPLPVRTAAQTVATLARAIHHAHTQNILHRDLKPANVLLTAAGEPKIADFGLAKLLDRDDGELNTTQAGTILGTPTYMPPEQIRGAHRLTPAADIYCLGGILYELLTGSQPFRGDSFAELVLKVCEQEPPPLSALNPQVDLALEAICLKCLRKKPEDRYATAQVLADDLERWLGGDVVLAWPLPAWPWWIRRWASRLWGKVSGIGGDP